MPAVTFDFGGGQFSTEISKVDRSQLYGFTRVETQDCGGRKCRLATLAPDGKTLIESGGTAMGFLSEDGTWREKSALKPVDPEGNEIQPVPSSFKAPIELTRQVSVEEYLAHAIHAAYLLSPQDGIDAALVSELRSGIIYSFEFSYRGGLNADAAFLLADAEGCVWMVVGRPVGIQFVGLEQAPPVSDEEESAAEEEEEALDFSMM